MKAQWKKLIDFASAVMAVLGSIVLFPHFSNLDLRQTKLNYQILGVVVVIISWGIVALTTKWLPKKKEAVYSTIGGVVSLVFFLVYLFKSYYPIIDRKVLDMSFTCGGSFIRGDSVNYAKLQDDKKAEYDSLSRYEPKTFVEKTNCDPSTAWTFDSIEDNFNSIVIRYILTVLLGSIGMIAFVKVFAITQANTRSKPKRKPSAP